MYAGGIMDQLKIFNCIKCPHYDIPLELTNGIITECFYFDFNKYGDCPCTRCEYINDCSDWCKEYYEFQEMVMELS